MFEYLVGNVEANGIRNVTLERSMVFDRNLDSVEFYEAPIEHFGMGSHAPQFHTSPVRVQAMTLDRVLKNHGLGRVDVVKVDVEGGEAAVFRGARSLLISERAPLVFFEFADWAEERFPGDRVGDSQRVLRELGYTIWTLESWLKGEPPTRDILVRGFETLVGARCA